MCALVPGLITSSSSLKDTLELFLLLLGRWMSRLPSSIVRVEMRLLWAVLNSVRFCQGMGRKAGQQYSLESNWGVIQVTDELNFTENSAMTCQFKKRYQELTSSSEG